jgi:phospholipid/cholesterol/gamma-HCH transport system substrate-binding protein
MRRVAAIIGLVAVGALVVFGQAASGTGGTYEVRAIFDNGNFLVPGEQVRVAGANVGTVSSVDVTMPDEWANRSCLEAPSSSACSTPGKAVVVLKITDPAFQDFRQDASCLIRPGSLLGEKYIDCQPTQPRAPGSQPPPPLTEIPSGQPGGGERFLPLENNGKEVDLDLVNNIMREPYADRFRLILNELGAGLAARGKTLDAIIRRADPALRQTDRVLAVLARQNHQLARLAEDSDTILTPLARERSHVAGFINNANTAAEATAERSQDLEAGLERFPAALHQLRLTMAKLTQFSDQATPVFAEFRAGAPAIARSTEALGPFARAATPALTTLGTAAQQSKKPLVNSDPILVAIRNLSEKAAPGAKNLGKLLTSLRKTDGDKFLLHFLYNTAGGINGFDQYGHFLRAGLVIPPGCTTLVTNIGLGCQALWGQAPSKVNGPLAARSAEAAVGAMAKGVPGIPAAKAQRGSRDPRWAKRPPGQPLDAQGEPPAGTTTTGTTTTGTTGTTTSAAPSVGQGPSLGAARDLLDTVIGRPHHKRLGGRR